MLGCYFSSPPDLQVLKRPAYLGRHRWTGRNFRASTAGPRGFFMATHRGIGEFLATGFFGPQIRGSFLFLVFQFFLGCFFLHSSSTADEQNPRFQKELPS